MDEFWTGSRDPVKITAIHQRMRGVDVTFNII